MDIEERRLSFSRPVWRGTGRHGVVFLNNANANELRDMAIFLRWPGKISKKN